MYAVLQIYVKQYKHQQSIKLDKDLSLLRRKALKTHFKKCLKSVSMIFQLFLLVIRGL